MNNKAVINIKDLVKKFKTNIVLNKLNLELSQGELIHIKGANGCGKSTLLKVICGILDKDSGEINISSNVYIGALIENPSFLEFHNLKYNLKFLSDFNHNYDEHKIKQLVSNFDLDFNSRQHLRHYSIGMRQKVGIIQAIMENQNVILLDEPTRGLDDESIIKFISIINNLISENKCVVIASHDKIDGLNYNHKYIMNDGVLFINND